MPRAVKLCLLANLLSLVIAGPAAAVDQADLFHRIAAMWQDTNPVPHEYCLSFIVKAWADQLLRGRISPHDCVAFAVREYRKGDHEQALGWLQAGLCPNREANNSSCARRRPCFSFS